MGRRNWKVGEGIPPIEAFHSQIKHKSVLYDDNDDTKNYEDKNEKKTIIK